jgi:hypothetical protein
MANADKPAGLRPVRYRNGGVYNGACNRYYVPSGDSTAIYVGGLVKLLAASADADGVMSVTGNVSTGNPVLGVVVGVEAVTQASTPYREASTARYVYVADEQDLLFAVQDDASATPTAANVGNVADLTGFTSGSTTSGLSSIEISMTTATNSGDGTEDVAILGVWNSPDNVIGNNTNWLVRLNNYQPLDGFTGI